MQLLRPATIAAAALAVAFGSHWLITRTAESGGLLAVALQWAVLVQHAGVHAALALGFALTLRRGQQPLISQLARRVHGRTGFTPAMAAYTRRLTQVWVLYFLTIALLSLALHGAGWVEAWSLLVNAVTPLSLLAMFAGEHLLRYRLHPEFERVGLMASVRAWRAHQADGSPR
ncbi:hypothetical protein [Sphaerotilus uruguayifluvii]|uniref:Membrane protein n=1 Tax=Sphaerotilus uruguayifluvii TaxID=2735897 RepID=A0ABX2G6L2_9BURK|nr:hypothetical protein [Leptothrix sp. C29]NRT57947.1 putative membrane protein [Leptothrix sp. C29]